MTDRISFQDQINSNKAKSVFLMFAIIVAFIIFSLLYTVISYYNADKIALASVRAKPASREEHKMLFNSVENMALASGLPAPRIYVMDSSEINAFASGRDPKHAVICVTTGALEKLNKQELE